MGSYYYRSVLQFSMSSNHDSFYGDQFWFCYVGWSALLVCGFKVMNMSYDATCLSPTADLCCMSHSLSKIFHFQSEGDLILVTTYNLAFCCVPLTVKQFFLPQYHWRRGPESGAEGRARAWEEDGQQRPWAPKGARHQRGLQGAGSHVPAAPEKREAPDQTAHPPSGCGRHT